MLNALEATIVRDPLIARADATVLSAVEQMYGLSRQGVNGDNAPSTCVVVVTEGQQVLGSLTERDVIGLVAQQQPIAQMTLGQFLQQHRSPSASLTIPESALSDVTAAIAHFEQQQLTHLPIVNAQNQLVGVLLYESLKRLRDITHHQATASLLASQQQILERIARAEPLTDVLSALLQTMEAYLPGTHCSITLCRDGRLCEAIAPSLPPDYARIISEMGLPITEGVGSCGTAAFRRELVVVSDIANDPLWKNDKHFVLGYGLQACSSMPIFASDQALLGTFGIYYREQKVPQAQDLDWIAQATNIAGIAIEHARANQALQQLNQELESRVQARTQELQEREQFLQTVLDTFPLSVFWKDVNSVYLGCNQNFLGDAGLQTIKQIIGKTDHEMPWGETEADLYRADDRAVIESRTAKLGIVETLHQANGQTIWLETNKLPLRNLQGEVIGVLGTYQDISDRKTTEFALQASETKFRRITESVPGMIFRYILHPDGRDELVYASPKVQQVFELTPEAVLQDLSRLWARFHTEDVPKIQSAIQDSVDSLQPFFVEARLLLPGDRLKWIQVSSQPDIQENGDIIWDGVVLDVTDRKKLEQEQAKLTAILEATPDYVGMANAQGEILWHNKQLRELRPELVSHDAHRLISDCHPDWANKIILEQALPTAIQSGSWSGELALRDGRGGEIPVSQVIIAHKSANGTVETFSTIMRDISDLKAAEKALMLKQNHLTALLNNIPHAAWIKDEESRVIAVNEPFAQAFGVLAEELVGKTDYDIWSADLAQAYRDDDAEVLQSGQRKVVVERGTKADGTLGWFETTKTPFRDDRLNIAGTVGITADITERKQAEQQLQELSERLELAIQSAQIGVWEFDFSSNRLFWDDRMLAIYGISPDAFHGTYDDWSSRVHPHDLPQAQPAISHEQAFYSAEFRIIRPDGTVRWIMSFSCKQRNLQGEFVRAVGVNLDISDRKQAETQINQQMAAIEAAIDGIGILRNGVYLYLNQAHVDLCGYASSTELIGKSWRILYSPTELTRFDQEIFPALERDRAWQGETICTRKDGSWLYTGLSLTLTDDDLLICVCRDISDRQEYEQRLKQSNAELMRATRLKNEFLANMSHELRTPLNAILGMTEILQEQIFGDLNNQQQQSLQTIESSSNHLLALINDILDVAKIEAGQAELDCQPTNIVTLCESSLDFIKQQAFNKNIRVERAIPSALPTIILDARRIRQVLINLLNNAVKFTPSGGKINLQVSYVPYPDHSAIADETVACNLLEISVVDTGIGIAPDQINRLFQPFVQVESALNRNYDGTGLGLALVKQLVELHGGQVGLTSELGVGSCFTISLPVATVAPLSIASEPSIAITPTAIACELGVAPVILLAEDNEENVNMLVDYLSLKGYRMVVANNGQIAVDLAQEIHPDLILMDIQMPGMDGLEAIQRIRQQPELADTPIIALTALAMPGDRERCLAAGANDYLSKPVKLQQLFQQINGYLNPH